VAWIGRVLEPVEPGGVEQLEVPVLEEHVGQVVHQVEAEFDLVCFLRDDDVFKQDVSCQFVCDGREFDSAVRERCCDITHRDEKFLREEAVVVAPESWGKGADNGGVLPRVRVTRTR
jgi:hypothetical protein